MATQSVEFSAPSGQTVTARLFSAGSDTVVQTASAVTEATNRDGVYTATFTDAAAGAYRLIATNSSGTLLAQWWVDLTLATATFQAYEMPVSVVQSGLSTLDAAGVRTAVGLASANLDTQLADLPTVSEFEARTLAAAAYFDPAADVVANVTTVGSVTGSVTVGTNNDKTGYSLTTGTGLGNQTANITGNLSGSVGSVTAGVTVTTNNDKTGYSLATAPPTAAAIADAVWDEATAGHTTADTYGGRIIRSTSSNVGVQITGSSHIAADVHEFQADVLTSDATAASFVSEVQAGLATSAALAVVDGIVDQLKSRSGYTMSILAGAISNAQNAAEAYTITLDGTAYGVTYSGLDSSGNRTGATLTET
jgi:hypothetical protein